MPGPRKGAPRSPVRRESVTVRLSPAGREALDKLADELDVRRSEVLRAVLAHAMADRKLIDRVRKTLVR